MKDTTHQSRRDSGALSPDALRVLVFSDAAPGRNGVGAYYQDLLEQLRHRLADIRLVCPTIDGRKWEAGLALPLPGDHTQKLCLPKLHSLNQLLGTMRPHVVVAATPGPYGVTGAWLARHRGIPYLTGLHTDFDHLTELYWGASLRGRIVEKYFHCSNAFLIRHTEAVLGNSDPILDQARRMGAPRVELIGTPIAPDFVCSPVRACSGRFQRLLFAGRLAREKNIEAIVAAARHCADLQFSIAGDGPERDAVLDAARELDNLHYLGWLSRTDLRLAVDEHDALLLPSFFETFGTIALEAMARERLVVVSEGCGISHWPELRRNLFVMAPGQPLYGLLDEIAAMAPATRQHHARLARDAAQRENSQVVENWCRILTATLRRREDRRAV